MIEAKAICDSINPHGSRLLTIQCKYPKFIHAEHLRHRAFSFSVSSSRAIPVAKNLAEVRDDALRAGPVWWGREQKGMSSGDELDNERKSVFWPEVIRALTLNVTATAEWITELECAKRLWKLDAIFGAMIAQIMSEHGVHKSIVNRRMEADLHVNVLVTGTTPGWMNFFGLRLDKAAQPEIRVLAEQMWRVWGESQPQKLEPGQWHLPFVDPDEYDLKLPWKPGDDPIRVSVSRSARLTYLSFETNRRSTIEENLALYERLVGSSPIHASPAEHQAMPDTKGKWVDATIQDHIVGEDWFWLNPKQAGNLGPGWRQYRKMLPGEAVAPLPEGFR